MFRRSINIPEDMSFFLFGARGTGKSTLLKSLFLPEQTLSFNLLEPSVEQRLITAPAAFEREVLSCRQHILHVIIDEVQKIPRLLDSIHNLMETHKVPQHFVLTGSSARKLKHGGANLLGGLAVLLELFRLSAEEVGADFCTDDALRFGSLPRIWNAKTARAKIDFLRAYTHIYLKEEVWAEQLVRKLDPFRRFLEVAAIHSGKILNYSSIASDVGTNDKSVQSWFTILQDTILGFHVEAFHTSVRKQMRRSPKFYFFDCGVSTALANMINVTPEPRTSYCRDLFEQFVVCEIHKRNTYDQLDYKLCYLKIKSGLEVDLVIQRPGKELAFVEIKFTDKLQQKNFLNWCHFQKEFPKSDFFLLSQDIRPQSYKNVTALHWSEGIRRL